MPFECFQCGECCAQLGLVYTIREDYGGGSFLVLNRYTGEETAVEVDPDKQDLFSDTTIFTSLPNSCPFFRHQPGSGKAYCTVHLTRPAICRDYGCWRLLILNHRGRRVGRIEYIRTLRSDDPLLTRIWEDCIEHDPEPCDTVWEDRMIRVLTRAGFTVRR